MKIALLFLVFALLVSGCGLREREQELEKKLAYVNQKEQELLLKEKSLQTFVGFLISIVVRQSQYKPLNALIVLHR